MMNSCFSLQRIPASFRTSENALMSWKIIKYCTEWLLIFVVVANLLLFLLLFNIQHPAGSCYVANKQFLLNYSLKIIYLHLSIFTVSVVDILSLAASVKLLRETRSAWLHVILMLVTFFFSQSVLFMTMTRWWNVFKILNIKSNNM